MFGRKKRRNNPHYPPFPIPNPYPIHSNQWGPYQNGEGRQFNPYYVNPYWNNNFINPGSNPYLWGMNGNYQYQGGYPSAQGEGQPSFSVESILQNPLQPKEKQAFGGTENTYMPNQYPYMHPYPKSNFTNRPPSVMNSIVKSFKAQDGSLDFNKMIDTAGQMMNTVTQVSGLVKGLGGIFKV